MFIHQPWQTSPPSSCDVCTSELLYSFCLCLPPPGQPTPGQRAKPQSRPPSLLCTTLKSPGRLPESSPPTSTNQVTLNDKPAHAELRRGETFPHEECRCAPAVRLQVHRGARKVKRHINVTPLHSGSSVTINTHVILWPAMHSSNFWPHFSDVLDMTDQEIKFRTLLRGSCLPPTETRYLKPTHLRYPIAVFGIVSNSLYEQSRLNSFRVVYTDCV